MQKRKVQNEILVGKGRCTLMCRRKEVHMDGRKCRIIQVHEGNTCGRNYQYTRQEIGKGRKRNYCLDFLQSHSTL